MEKHLQRGFVTNIDIKRYEHNVELGEFVQGDIKSSYLGFNIKNGNRPYDLTGCEVIYQIKKPDGTKVSSIGEISMPTRGYVECAIGGQALLIDGICELEISIIKGGAKLTSHKVRYMVNPSLFETIGISQDEVTILSQLMDRVHEYAEMVRTEEETRKNSENNRIEKENERISAETDRDNSETQRKRNETTRIEKENVRISNEESRVSSETQREQSEQTRNSNETGRVQAEERRVEEFSRMTTELESLNTKVTEDENARVNAEITRVSNESNRVAAENKRVSDFETMNTEFEQLSIDLGEVITIGEENNSDFNKFNTKAK